MKRSGFKKKPYSLMKRSNLTKRTKLRLVGHETTKELKSEIQSLLRNIVILRDGGCILRHYTSMITPQYKECGPYRKDGQIILQAEHLHTRSNAASFSDSRLVICLCQRHHIYYKPQHADEYYKIVRKHIGTIRSILLDRVQKDWMPHKVDLKLEILALKNEYNKMMQLYGK